MSGKSNSEAINDVYEAAMEKRTEREKWVKEVDEKIELMEQFALGILEAFNRLTDSNKETQEEVATLAKMVSEMDIKDKKPMERQEGKNRYLSAQLSELHKNYGVGTPDDLFYKWVDGFDFPDEMYEPIRILAEAWINDAQERIRDYFFWGEWEDEEETIPANVERKIRVLVSPYKGFISIVWSDRYKLNGEFFNGQTIEYFPSPFMLPKDKNKHGNEALFEIAYNGRMSTQEERNENRSLAVIDGIVHSKTLANEVIKERTNLL